MVSRRGVRDVDSSKPVIPRYVKRARVLASGRVVPRGLVLALLKSSSAPLMNGELMRIAIISDVHGNLTALDAVLADLRQQTPDVMFHGVDIPYGGCNPCEVIDCIRQEGWQGVLGNTDEMLWNTEPRAALEA